MGDKDWIECKLAEACRSIDYGLTASAVDSDVGPRFLRITDIVSGSIDWKAVPHVIANQTTEKKYRLDDGDVVIARTGASTGASAYVKKPPLAVFASYLVRLKTKPDFDSRFIAYYLKSAAFWSFIRAVLGDKSAQPNASASTMTQAPLRAPKSIETQRTIAHILGALDDKIELNRKMNETLEAMARAVFKSWFVDFDPIPGLGPNREWQDSPLGRIPKGWSAVPLPEAIEVNPPRTLRKGTVAPYLDMANMPTRSARAMEVYDREFGSGTRFINGDTLVARITPCLENGKTCFVDFLGVGKVGWGSTEYIVLRPKLPLPPEFAYFLSRTEDFRSFAISNMTGSSGRQRVPADAFNQFFIVIPPEEIVNQFGRFARTAMDKMKANDEQSRTLAAIRDALLPKLLSGDIRVKDAEKFAEVV